VNKQQSLSFLNLNSNLENVHKCNFAILINDKRLKLHPKVKVTTAI